MKIIIVIIILRRHCQASLHSNSPSVFITLTDRISDHLMDWSATIPRVSRTSMSSVQLNARKITKFCEYDTAKSLASWCTGVQSYGMAWIGFCLLQNWGCRIRAYIRNKITILTVGLSYNIVLQLIDGRLIEASLVWGETPEIFFWKFTWMRTFLPRDATQSAVLHVVCLSVRLCVTLR